MTLEVDFYRKAKWIILDQSNWIIFHRVKLFYKYYGRNSNLARNAQELRGAPRGVPAGGERGAIHDRTQELRKPQAQGNRFKKCWETYFTLHIVLL